MSPDRAENGSSHVVAIDVGNSRIKLGLLEFKSDAPSAELPQLRAMLAVPHGQPIPWEQVSDWYKLPGLRPASAVVAGVNPDGVKRVLDEWPQDLEKPRHLRDYRELGLPVHVDFPERVGIDRLLNGVAARHFQEGQRQVLIVDSGTATTVDCVSAEGAFEGGAILPGLELSGRALHQYTALLPQVLPKELMPSCSYPDAIGKNTHDAIRSGLFWGQIGAIRELIRQMTPKRSKPRIILTGGAAFLLLPHLEDLGEVLWQEHFPLKGLALVLVGRMPAASLSSKPRESGRA